MISNYYNKAAVAAAIDKGDHRTFIGGMWDEIGGLQMSFLEANGLKPDNVLLDIGCGSLRLGVRAVEFLEPGNYWGTDLNRELLDAGYEKEIVPAGLSAKLPREQLVTDEEFDFAGVPTSIDFAIATSVFTHLPLNHMRLCLAKLARHVTSPCTFYFSVFTAPEGFPLMDSYEQPKGGVVTYAHRDPYHYWLADLHHAAAGTPWSIEFIGDWGHPRNQMIVKAWKD
ncbi:MAG TPA: class I SAM-dependent methyltransferase [Sphingomicrobium sp.]|nr:class I SAM-dependent methyltransferase [Sphingomicrobium sp.]